MFNSTNPSISTAYPYVFVSWEADRAFEVQDKLTGIPTNPHRVFVRGFAPWVGWAPVTEFDYYSQTEQNSSVGIDRRLGYGKVNVAWDCSGGDVVKAARDISGVQWSGIGTIGQGKYPTLEHFVSVRPSYAMYTTGSAPPFSISLNNSFSSLLDQGSKLITMGNGEMFPIELSNRSRAGSVRLDSLRVGRRERGALSGNLWVISAAFTISRGASREPIPFSQDTADFSEWLGTESIVVPHDAQRIEVTLWLTLRNFAIADRNIPNGTGIVTTQFEVENGSRTIVRRITLGDIKRYQGVDTTIAIPISIPAVPLRGKTLRLRQNLVGQEDAQQPAWSELIRIDSVTSNSIQNRLLGKGGSETPQAIPTDFAVHEGYPNPFNPSTTINYDLPEPSRVSLVIYDVLGRKVIELENGMKEAGYHSSTWNANKVASGVYFARFTAADANGNVKLNKITKLLLAK